MVMSLLNTTLAYNEELLTSVLETEMTMNRHRAMPMANFRKRYPVGMLLFRRIVAMAKNFVMRDNRYRSRPGSDISEECMAIIDPYVCQSITRILRGHQQDGAVEDQDTGETTLPL
jgi:hypothetical protein